MRSLSFTSVVSRLRYNDASPSRMISGRRQGPEIKYQVPQEIVKHSRDNTKVKFFSPYTAVGQGLNVSHFINVETLMRQAHRMIRAKKRIFDLIHSGKFVKMAGLKGTDKIVSVAQMTAQLLPENTDQPIHGRHVSTQLLAAAPDILSKAVALPIKRSPTGDMVFYEYGGDCEFNVNARKKDHNCARIQGHYEDFQRIKLGEREVYIVTDKYPEVKVECHGKSGKFILNQGLFAFVISGKYTIKFSDSKSAQSDPIQEGDCEFRVIVNKSVGTEPMSAVQSLINKTLIKLGLFSSALQHGIIFVALTFIIITLIAMIFIQFWRERRNRIEASQNQAELGELGETSRLVPAHAVEIRRVEDEVCDLAVTVNKLKTQIQDTEVMMMNRH